nr:MAG TPA: hypothetical protein [Caudoviricetes sp.]
MEYKLVCFIVLIIMLLFPATKVVIYFVIKSLLEEKCI